MVHDICHRLDHRAVKMDETSLTGLVRIRTELLEIGNKLVDLNRVCCFTTSHRQNDEISLHIGLIRRPLKTD